MQLIIAQMRLAKQQYQVFLYKQSASTKKIVQENSG
jgi:hypothetical protein